MARIRSIYPAACTSQKLSAIGSDAERLYWRMQTECDDEGRIEDAPVLIAARCVPLLQWPAEMVDELLWELAEIGLIVRYESDDHDLIQVENWTSFQKPRHPQRSTFPAPITAKRRNVTAEGRSPTDNAPVTAVRRGVEGRGRDTATAARVLQEACELVAGRRRVDERAAEKSDPGAWLAAARSGIRSELLGIGVHDDPGAWADALEPERPAAPARTDPTAEASAAQRKRAERDMRVARGEPACSACFDVGYTEQPDGTMARCRECNP